MEVIIDTSKTVFEVYCSAYRQYTGQSLPRFKAMAFKQFNMYIGTFAHKYFMSQADLKACVLFCYETNPLNAQDLRAYGVAENFVKSFQSYKKHAEVYKGRIVKSETSNQLAGIDNDYGNDYGS